MSKGINPELNVGDRIICYHMQDETSVPPGTEGVVKKITQDPFEKDAKIINVNWENGSNLALISSTDLWKKVSQEPLQESQNSEWDYMTENPDIFDYFDWKWLRQFLYKIRESGIVNMFGVAPLLYAGKEHIDRYYGEGREDDERFQEVLNDADRAKDKIVQGVVKYMKANNKNLNDMMTVNRYAQHFSQKIVGLYMAMSKMGNQS